MSYVDCLRYEPWDGGKGDDPYRVLSDCLIRTRKPHECVICFDQIPAGAGGIRARTELQLERRGKVRTFYFCEPCCHAMAALIDGRDPRGREIEERTVLGIRRANRRETAP